MKGKLKIILPVLLLVLVGAGGAYKFLLSGGGSAKKAAPPKVVGDLLPLSPDFTINLDGGHYGKVSVALELLRRRARVGRRVGDADAHGERGRALGRHQRPHRPHDRRADPAAHARASS